MLTGTVTGAADVLHVSQPGISRMLAHIELQLGLRLFERGPRLLRPTPEAHALFEEVEQVYRGVGRIGERAKSLRSGEHMGLRILASPSTAQQVVPRAVARLVADFPGARVYVETQLAKEMASALTRQMADVAVSTLDITQPLLTAEEVGEWSLVCVFPQGHRLETLPALTLREVLKDPLIAFNADTPQGQYLRQWCAQQRVALSSRIEVRSGQMACSLTAHGAGIAIVDNLTAQSWAAQGLRYRALQQAPRYKVLAVRNANAPASLLQRAFVAHLMRQFQETQEPT
jgi:DNA-binding transcriptional LysR family regulator